jgi:hypothetical protein
LNPINDPIKTKGIEIPIHKTRIVIKALIGIEAEDSSKLKLIFSIININRAKPGNPKAVNMVHLIQYFPLN